MRYDGESIKETNLSTHAYGKTRKVFQDTEKVDANGNYKLYFKYSNHLHGTFIEHCYRVDK